MATIEGKSSAEWFKDAAQRQKRSNAYAKYEEPPKPAPSRQTAALPKPASHASPAKDTSSLIRETQERITKARAPEAKRTEPAKVRPAPGPAKGNEHRWNADLQEAKQAGRVRSIVRRAEDEGRSSLHRLQSEARAKVAAEAGRKKQRESDEWESKNFLEKADTAFNKVEKPVLKAAGRAAEAGGKAAVAVGGAAVGYLGQARRWLGGDPDARRRLRAAK